ncbi:hypothetical protein H1R20_g919, partial [Candolleomyces eurysporus]
MERSFDTPKCDEDTRVGLKEEIMNWAESDDTPSKFLCMTGSAGSGKSALAQTISESCGRRRLGPATFFFSVSDPLRNNPSRFVASLAYQISRSMEEVETHILLAVEKDPAIFKMSLETQAEALLIDPILEAIDTGSLSRSKKPKIIVVDGLDECKGEQHQAETFVSIYVGDCGRLGRAKGDVHWPSEDLLEILVEGASGQFIFAATVFKFVGDRRRPPFRRLQVVIDWISNSPNKQSQNPFASLDALYTKILSAAQTAYQESFEGEGECPSLIKRLMSYMLINDLYIIEHRNPVNPGAAEHILKWEDDECNRIVEDLHSVILVQQNPSSDGAQISFYHKSFLDYLLDSSRCRSFHVSSAELFADLTLKALGHVIAVDLDSSSMPRHFRTTLPDPDAIPEPFQGALVPPPIACENPAKGISHLVRVFAIPLHPKRMQDFVTENLPSLAKGLDGSGKLDLFCDWVGDFLPPGLKPELAFIVVPVKRNVLWETVGVVLANNCSEEEREKAKDEDMIKEVQKRLGVVTRPGWHVVLPE